MVVGSLFEKFVMSSLRRFGRKCRDLLGDDDVGLVESRAIGSHHHDVLEVGTARCIGINPFLKGAEFQFVECEYVYGIQR